MEEKELQNELTSIRSLMERSSKFISLSGLSGILAGVYALIGAGAGYKIINDDPFYQSLRDAPTRSDAAAAPVKGLFYGGGFGDIFTPLIAQLLLIAIVVLIASVVTAVVLSSRQAKRKGVPMWGSVSKSLLFHMAVPLLTGGILIGILIIHHHYGIVAAASLIFYGLALVSAGNFTFGEVKYLGLCEVVLGLITACLPGHGLLFWAFGFGVLHIIYGGLMYFKYDK